MPRHRRSSRPARQTFPLGIVEPAILGEPHLAPLQIALFVRDDFHPGAGFTVPKELIRRMAGEAIGDPQVVPVDLRALVLGNRGAPPQQSTTNRNH